ncbi:4-(cytidine 5'-diphospho)-2-C-methyl-D-erythritol kinase [Desulfoferrobacter suflitae]|uniref:4-(cytidine 5'-diphospho)-2-C-methyl-D-erythritol kinase n=1 Tax=Desulfoferrobacter suflitae TaxID=2865782 RepID=UPI002164B874|nr:4-(cytidine 5'-diphospho)-2-C-methyl-D-erythritol kinase [Desulfoferrobacter suflitae]MCK8600715.1 4-(cytidine 5'-diphospho)-2-C-methyl-D-erythritol kinase [Desulfoferrobacter suflitae]
MPIQISIPAKINLWLEILGKRSDGYHELSSLMLPIGVYDHLQLDHRSAGIQLACSHREIPSDHNNLAHKAARLYLARAESGSGVSILLDKGIPVGAGLGGGSADAAAVLLAMNRLFQNRLSLQELSEMAHMLGADVPFFLHQSPALATGIGEKIELLDGVPEFPIVLIKPPITVSTGWVYQRLKLTRGVSRIRISTFLARPWQLRDFLENDLEFVTLHEYPLLNSIKEWLENHGAEGTLMSGSGPTVFGVFADESRAQGVGKLAEIRWKGCWVATTKTQSAPAGVFR